MKIKNTSNVIKKVLGFGAFQPGEVKEVPADLAAELLICDGWESAEPEKDFFKGKASKEDDSED